MLETSPLFISLVGSPASGKSYFLTAMTWELRHMLPKAHFSFSDADPSANVLIHRYEENLFLNAADDVPTEIIKTQPDDPHLYRTAMVGGAPVRFPTPLQFTLTPLQDHPQYHNSRNLGRILVMYDNAGEDFLPGSDNIAR